MRDYVLLYINGKRVEVKGHDSVHTLSDFLRYEKGMKGTKVVCAEGDCGACSVLVANLAHEKNGKLTYYPVNSCIALVANLDSTHIITVEGFKDSCGNLNPVQEAMVTEHGSQCGYCTPGFVAALSCMVENRLNEKKSIDRKAVQNALTGNLCRCTGYESIIDSGLAIDTKKWKGLESEYKMKEILADLKDHYAQGVHIKDKDFNYYAPKTLKEALSLKNSTLRLIAGASDLGVQINKRGLDRSNFMSLSHIEELYKIEINSDHVLIGANANLTDICDKLENEFSEFCNMINVFASPQIKNRATLVGNIVNASPVADSVPFLMSVNASLMVVSKNGSREININDFYKGYKSFDLSDSEIITGVKIPKMAKNEFVKLYKVSLRRDMDISAVTFAAHTKIDAGKISDIRISYGGVGPVVLRMPSVEAKLKGRDFSKTSFSDLDDLIEKGMTPMSDVRGSDKFRYTVSKNLMQKFYFESLELVSKL